MLVSWYGNIVTISGCPEPEKNDNLIGELDNPESIFHTHNWLINNRLLNYQIESLAQ
jgi:hypothetical protein